MKIFVKKWNINFGEYLSEFALAQFSQGTKVFIPALYEPFMRGILNPH